MSQAPVALRTAPLSDGEIIAIKAVAKGEATPYQQRLSLAAIVKKLSRVNDLAFIPGNPVDSAFLAGRTFVGKQVFKYIGFPNEGLMQEIE